MTRASGLVAVNCTACGAGLNVLGGGRVRVHVCPYCGAELDAQRSYKVLRQHSDLKRPDSPFRVGQTGRLFDVDWTIIGTLGKRDSGWEWVEHQLYSPTHGYAWLAVDRGHVTFARRIRKASHPPDMSVKWVESAEAKPTVLLNGDRYTYYETSNAEVTFLEGEFTWAPKMGARGTTVAALSKDAMLEFSRTGKEREMYRSVYLDADEVAQAFGLESAPLPQGMHPLKPFRTGRHDGFLIASSGLFLALSLILALAFAFWSGRTVLANETVPLTGLPVSIPFEVTDTERLVRLSLFGNPVNAWAFLEMEVIDPEDATLFETGRSMEYYNGRDADGAWTEGRRDTVVRFRPTQPGTYTLVLHEIENELWQASGRPMDQVRLSITEGVRTSGWLIALMVVFAALAGWPLARRSWHHKRRWAGSDWTEEE